MRVARQFTGGKGRIEIPVPLGTTEKSANMPSVFARVGENTIINSECARLQASLTGLGPDCPLRPASELAGYFQTVPTGPAHCSTVSE